MAVTAFWIRSAAANRSYLKTAWLAFISAGAVPMDPAGVASELQKTWCRDNAQEWANVYTRIFPAYQLLIDAVESSSGRKEPGTARFMAVEQDWVLPVARDAGEWAGKQQTLRQRRRVRQPSGAACIAAASL